jgi:hypothetical protein
VYGVHRGRRLVYGVHRGRRLVYGVHRGAYLFTAFCRALGVVLQRRECSVQPTTGGGRVGRLSGGDLGRCMLWGVCNKGQGTCM